MTAAQRNFDRKLRRAYAALNSATGSDSLIQATFRLLALEFPGGFTSVTLRNMDSRPNFWLSSRGHQLELGPTPAAFDKHPAAEYVKKNPGVKAARSSDVLPSGATLRQTEFYKQSMKPMGWEYSLALFFWIGDSLDCIFSAFRSARENDYTLRELRKAEQLHESVNRALQRVKALEARYATLKGLQALVEQLPLPAAIVDWNLKPVFHNTAARDLCGELRQEKNSGRLKHRRADFELPAALLKVCQQFKTRCANEINTSPAQLRGKRSTKRFRSSSLKASVTLIPAPYPSVGEPSFLLKLEKTRSKPPLISPNGFVKLEKLTRSQRDIVKLTCEGKSNQEIAESLCRSLGTVKNEMSAIFKRLGVASRNQLMVLFR